MPLRRALRIGLVTVGCVLAAAPVFAQARVNLTVSPAATNFPSGDPDTTPSIASAPPIVVTVRVRQNTGPWQLTVLANGDLVSGLAVVDITNVTWTAAPAPFQNGTLSKTLAQRMASGTGTVNPAQNGSVTFRLANSWNYTAATYQQTLVFTLSAP